MTQKEAKMKNSDNTLKWILGRSKGQRHKIALLTAGNAVYSACGVGFALLCRSAVDSAVSGSREGLFGAGLGIGALLLLQLITLAVCGAAEESASAGLGITLRRGVLDELMKKEYAGVSAYHSGELMNRMFSDVSVISGGVVGLLPALVGFLAQLVCAAAVMLMLDTGFAAIFIAAGGVLFLITRLLRGTVKKLHKQAQEQEGKTRSFLQECVEGLLTVKVFGAERKMREKDRVNQENWYKIRMRRAAVTVAANTGFSLVFQGGYFFALIWGAAGILSGALSFGTLTAVLQLVNQIQSPFAGLSSLVPRYYAMIASAERLIELEKLPDEPPAGKTAAPEDFTGVSARDICFSYGENRVISGASFDISRGDFVSVTGISGGGKTTLFLLLLGAYRPCSGRLSFRCADGEYSAGRETRGLFAYVPQGNCLFSGTIAENIAFLREGASLDEIKKAAETACALGFIEELPDGFDTRIGENNSGVSEGQAQRIAIARAILSGAPILLLDEATSALDEAAEAQLIENISRLEGRTLIIVTHRPAALKICNKHLIVKDGEIYEKMQEQR